MGQRRAVLKAPFFEVLASHHDRAGFDCGEESLNVYLQRFARQNAKRDYGVTTVAVYPAQPRRILAFFTFSASKVEPQVWPDELKTPPFGAPTLLLARLAVDRAFAGQGVGELCLFEVFERLALVAQSVGVCALEVDALNERAALYYAHYGFVPFQDSPLHLYLPIALIRQQLLARQAVP